MLYGSSYFTHATVWTASTLAVPALTVNLWMTAANKNRWDRFADTCCTQAKPVNLEMQVQPPGTRAIKSRSHQSPLSIEWTKQFNQHLKRTARKSVSWILYLLEYNNLPILQPKHRVKGNRAYLMLSDVWGGGVTLSGGLWLGNHFFQRVCQPVHSDYVNQLWKSLPIMLTWKVLNIEKQPLSDEF